MLVLLTRRILDIRSFHILPLGTLLHQLLFAPSGYRANKSKRRRACLFGHLVIDIGSSRQHPFVCRLRPPLRELYSSNSVLSHLERGFKRRQYHKHQRAKATKLGKRMLQVLLQLSYSIKS